MVYARLLHKKCDVNRVKDIDLNAEEIKEAMTKPATELRDYDFATMRWLFKKI